MRKPVGKSWQELATVEDGCARVQGCRYTWGARVHVFLGCEGACIPGVRGYMYTWGARGMLTMSPSTSGSHKKEFELKSSD